MKTFTIGQVAEMSDISPEALRFYERQGLIAKPRRKKSGYRQYDEGVFSTLRFIKRAKNLGFTLNEIKELLHLHCIPGKTKADVKRIAEMKIREISAKIDTLQRMKFALEKLNEQCDGEGLLDNCPILKALEDEKPESEFYDAVNQACHH